MKAQEHSRSTSFDWTIVREALKSAMPSGGRISGKNGLSVRNRDIDISFLINEVFGGEIVKSHTRRGWHFYNRINGERIDLAGQDEISSSTDLDSGSKSVAMADTPGNFEQNDYTTLFQRFVTALEDSFGLGKYQPA